jgi:hypothetical protein
VGAWAMQAGAVPGECQWVLARWLAGRQRLPCCAPAPRRT